VDFEHGAPGVEETSCWWISATVGCRPEERDTYSASATGECQALGEREATKVRMQQRGVEAVAGADRVDRDGPTMSWLLITETSVSVTGDPIENA
jgi:hypothetical protein